MTFFGKKYKIRRFNSPQFVSGHECLGYTDGYAVLDVQEEQPDTLALHEEGAISSARLVCYGNDEMIAEDNIRGRKGDLLFYNGEVYKCVSCNKYHHTMLKHYNSAWTRISTEEGGVCDCN